MLGDRFQGLQIIFRCCAGPRGNRAIVKRFAFVRHNQHRIEFHLGAKAITGRAGAKRVIKREQTWFNFFNRKARNRAGELGGKHRGVARFGVFGQNNAVGQFKGGFKTIRKARSDAVLDDQAINNNRNIVFEFLVEVRGIVDVIHFAIDLDALETARPQIT